MSILVVVAHSDDECIGMAGTIAKHTSEGEKVFGIYLTNGVGSRKNSNDESKKRAIAADLAAKEIGLEWVGKFNFPDNALDTVALIDIVKVIEKIKELIKPRMVYTHHHGDLNIDHQITFQATMTAFRPHPEDSCKEIRTFEVASATEYGSFGSRNSFVPNLYVDVTNFWNAKENALKHYEIELRKEPHPRSVAGLNYLSKTRGMSVGLNQAECFCVIRKIIDD